jgi:tetratricopeptide (TPR) repeat protein
VRQEALKNARMLYEAGEVGEAAGVLKNLLLANPDDAAALSGAVEIFDKADNLPVAYHLAKRLVELEPTRVDAWTGLGWLADRLWRSEEAERYYRTALKKCANDEQKAKVLMNLAGLYIHQGEFARAEPMCHNALGLDPMLRKAKSNLGFCQLAARRWDKAWKNYHFTLGSPTRKKVQYDNEPEWDGTKGLTVAIYGEQGLGDEISFASMIPDAVEDCEKVVIDCDARLSNLFRRSFPKATVYGTRDDKSLNWAPSDRKIHASLAMGALGGLYRLSAESFPGTAYLTPDPSRVLMWKALWAAKAKPVIGVAWTGGTYANGSNYRAWTLKDLLPIFQSVDAHWVCLQYKDAREEIEAFTAEHPDIDLVQYPYATLTNDYDDTAALVASLDRVVSMQTAVVHLSGALGIPCDVFVPKNSQWRYGEHFTTVPWYRSVNVIRQAVRGHWSNTIKQYAEQLNGNLDSRAA